MPQLAPLLLGLLLAAYWGRVVLLVRKIRRQTGQSANYMPREPVGRALRLLWNPVVVLWIADPWLVAWLPAHMVPAVLRPLGAWPWLVWPGVAVAAGAFGATLVCWKRMGRSWRMGINPDEKTNLIVTGPYAYLRHPIYALSGLMMLGSMAVVPSPVLLAAGVIHILLLRWEAAREESYLLATHGEAYAAYQRATGRFVPWPGRKYRVGEAERE
jgi:protein-S-isoprenylcysteine O-methyltransferase Ste14